MSPLTEALSDRELAQAAAVGEIWAFEELYRRYRKKVYSFCVRMLGHIPDAEEATQEVFLQLYRKIGTFKGTAAFSTWLYRLMTNTALMYVRIHRRKAHEELLEEEPPRGIRETRVGSDESLISRIDLEWAISRLPPGYRLIFLLHDVEGYKHKEIANLLGIARGTARSQLHKARLKLRELLTEGSACSPSDRCAAEVLRGEM